MDNYQKLKKELEEISKIVEKYPEELKEKVFDELLSLYNAESGNDKLDDSPTKSKAKKKTAVKNANKFDKEKKTGRKTSGKPGPGEIISILLSEGFFDKWKTVNDIITHCDKNLGYKYKSNELSTSFTRAIRSKKLIRQQNKDKQYEYKKS